MKGEYSRAAAVENKARPSCALASLPEIAETSSCAPSPLPLLHFRSSAPPPRPRPTARIMVGLVLLLLAIVVVLLLLLLVVVEAAGFSWSLPFPFIRLYPSSLSPLPVAHFPINIPRGILFCSAAWDCWTGLPHQQLLNKPATGLATAPGHSSHTNIPIQPPVARNSEKPHSSCQKAAICQPVYLYAEFLTHNTTLSFRFYYILFWPKDSRLTSLKRWHGCC